MRTTVLCSLAAFTCLLPVLLNGCLLVRTLQDNFKLSPRPTELQATALPTMEVPVRMRYPNGTKTVGGATSYMLEPHSYRPAGRNTTTDIIAQRTFINNFDDDPVPLYVAMKRLMGADGQIVLDRKSKLYTFRTKKPDEASIAFADLKTTPFAAESSEASCPDDCAADSSEDEETAGENRESCNHIQFRSQTMLSAAVQEYFLRCGFDKVSWSLGEPGSYADYQLLQNTNLPLPERHQDLIEFLLSRFGIKTLIHDNNRVEFYDENNLL